MPGLRPFVKNGRQNVNLSTGRAGTGRSPVVFTNVFSSRNSSSSSGIGTGSGGSTGRGAAKRIASRKVGDEWSIKECKSHVEWVNEVFCAHKISTSVTELREVFSTGVTLVQLIEALSHASVPGATRSASTKTQRERNLTKCLDFLQNNGICATRPSLQEISSGSLKPLILIVKSLRLKYDRSSQNEHDTAPITNGLYNSVEAGARMSAPATISRRRLSASNFDTMNLENLKSRTVKPPEVPRVPSKDKEVSETQLSNLPIIVNGEENLHMNDSSVCVTTEDLFNSNNLPHIASADYGIHRIQLLPKCLPTGVAGGDTVPMPAAPGGPPPPPESPPPAETVPSLVLPQPKILQNSKPPAESVHIIVPSVEDSYNFAPGAIPSPTPVSNEEAVNPGGPPNSDHIHIPLRRRHPPPRHLQPRYSRHDFYDNQAFVESELRAPGGVSVWQLGAQHSQLGRMEPQEQQQHNLPQEVLPGGVAGSLASHDLSSDVFTDVEDAAVLNYDPVPSTMSDPLRRPNKPLGYYSEQNLRSKVRRRSDSDSSAGFPDIPVLAQPVTEEPHRGSVSAPSSHVDVSHFHLTNPRFDSMYDSDTGMSAPSEGGIFAEDTEVMALRQRLVHLERLYQEMVRLMGVEEASVLQNVSQPDLPEHRQPRHMRANSSKELKIVNKRLAKLETHVVTLARSVGQLSSELGQVYQMIAPEHNSGPEHVPTENHLLQYLRRPRSVKKLTWFFGSEPPFVERFLEDLGYSNLTSLFKTEQIGLLELGFLSEERLQQLGVPLGPRLRIIEELQQVRASIV